MTKSICPICISWLLSHPTLYKHVKCNTCGFTAKDIDMLNPDDKASKYFIYKELLWLSSWNRVAGSQDGLNDKILKRLCFMATKLDQIRDFFNKPINVHVFWRPDAYNATIGGALNSAHRASVDYMGDALHDEDMDAACDFDVQGLTCDEVREKILEYNLLEKFGLRMEKKPGSNWVHLDCRAPQPGHPRYFIP